MTKRASPWKFVIIPATIMAFLAIYPQLSLLLANGGNWRGSYFSSNYDEVAYSAYINALSGGRPRKFDPFLDRPTDFESLYSIQFIPAYSIAWPALFLGVSTSTAFIALGILIAVGSALSLYLLIREITYDNLLAASGTVAILCLGTAAAYQGELRILIDGHVLIEYLPFLRRYQPGFAFPLYFIFCLLVWRGAKSHSRRAVMIHCVAAGVVFDVLVFSYFYLWTAAAGWLACFGIIWMIFKRAQWRRLVTIVATIGTFGSGALIPYFLLLGDRSPNVDSTQLLARSHMPDVSSATLLIGLAVSGAIFWAVRKGLVRFSDQTAVFALSFSVTPMILFNQQVVTGRSLQPAHYEIFISNYLVLTAAVITLSIWIRAKSTETGITFRKGLVYLLLIAFGWGLIETVNSSGRNAAAAVIRDESVPVLRYIQEQETKAPSAWPVVIHATNFVTADLIPSETLQRPLWNAHINSAGGLDAAENKRLFYLYLYYNGFTENDLTTFLSINSFEISAAIFGSDRALPVLSEGAKSITSEEIRLEARKYAEFIQNFSKSNASDPTLSWLIVPVRSEQDTTNIDKWYQRRLAREFGTFKVYRLSLK